METFHTFNTWQEAAQFRAMNGTGGFIFVPVTEKELGDNSILFPVGYTPSKIFNHVLTCGLSGELI